jgi:threonine synthase
MSALVDLACPECDRIFDADQVQTVCEGCDSPLWARYDLAHLAGKLDREQISNRPKGVWRWHELLPVRDPVFRITLGEGDTSLISAPRIAEELGLGSLFVKDEGSNPTGTFKARGMAVALSRAGELGLREFVIPTAGNAGGAMATYASHAGFEAHVFMPADAPTVNQTEVRMSGADLRLVDGLIDMAGRRAKDEARANGWFNMTTFKEPYRVEGKKTMGFELAEAFGWHLPEVIVYPTGGGTGLVGMWKAFEELETLGWIDGPRPRLVSVQAAGCAPIVRALENEADRVEPWENPTTIAHGIRTPGAYADRLILRAVRQSGGVGVTVTDEEIRGARDDLAKREGILACLEGAATLAGLRRLVETGWVERNDRVVIFNTGTGLKDLS